MAQIEGVVQRACANDYWLTPHEPVFTWNLLWPPYATSPGSRACRRQGVCAQRLARPGAAAAAGLLGMCDLTWMKARGIEDLVYDSRAERVAHAEDEYIPFPSSFTRRRPTPWHR